MTLRKSLPSVNKHASAVAGRELTFASLCALLPAVTPIPDASAPTILVPSTSWSATTDSARFLERAAVWTFTNCRDDVWHGGWRSDGCVYYSVCYSPPS